MLTPEFAGELPGEHLPLATAQQRSPQILDLWESAPSSSRQDSAPWGSFLHVALKARWCFTEGVDYLVIDGAVKIVDPASGRLMDKTRWTDMLHQVFHLLQPICSGLLSHITHYDIMLRTLPPSCNADQHLASHDPFSCCSSCCPSLAVNLLAG